MSNPFVPPTPTLPIAPLVIPSYRMASYVLTVFAIVIATIHLPPFLTNPLLSRGWQSWWFGFVPAAYLVFAAAIALGCEGYSKRDGLIFLPLFLFPLLPVTGLILFAVYLDTPRLLAGEFTLWQKIHMLMIWSLCPVVWYYFAVSIGRSWQLLWPWKPR